MFLDVGISQSKDAKAVQIQGGDDAASPVIAGQDKQWRDVDRFVATLCGSAQLSTHYGSTRTYMLPKADVRVSRLFRILEKNKKT